jgi:uncharacterized protein (DUF1778 family)
MQTRAKVKAKANADTECREVLILNRRERRRLVEALLNPPAPNAKLRAAAERYQSLVRSS